MTEDEHEYEVALAEFLDRYAFYMEKVERRYRSFGDVDIDIVDGAWRRFLRIRKKLKGF